jgi:hypothetical protein
VTVTIQKRFRATFAYVVTQLGTTQLIGPTFHARAGDNTTVDCGVWPAVFFFDIDRPTSSAIGQICSESESEVYAVFAHS